MTKKKKRLLVVVVLAVVLVALLARQVVNLVIEWLDPGQVADGKLALAICNKCFEKGLIVRRRDGKTIK